MDWQQKFIADTFNGDVEQYKWAVADGRRHAIQWDDFLTAAITLPNLHQETQTLIERRLGYLPHESITLPYEPFLRGLIQSHRQGALSNTEFTEQADEHIKLIRNADLKHNTCLDYDPRIYQNYEAYPSHYKEQAKNRLAGFLGYEPKLEHSLIAEMWLCKIIAKDTFQLPQHITAIDLKCLTLIKYREILVEHGRALADISALLGSKHRMKNKA